MASHDFPAVMMKFSPYIKKITKQIYPSPQSLKTQAWHSWRIPFDMPLDEFYESLSILLGEYQLKGAYREELSTYAFDEDPKVPQIMIHVQSKAGVHIFLLGTFSSQSQYALFMEVVREQKLQLRELKEKFIAMLDGENPTQHHRMTTETQIEAALKKHSSLFIPQASSAQTALYSLYDALIMNHIGHSIENADIFILEEENDSLCAFLLFRGGVFRETQVGVPIYLSNNPLCSKVKAELLLDLPTGIKPSFLQNSSPIPTSYSRWIINGIEIGCETVNHFLYLLLMSHFLEDQAVSINTIHFNERGMTSKNGDSVFSLFNFAVPSVKQVTNSRASDAFSSARLNAVPPALFSHSEYEI
ncbi:hypothetical protein [Halodesulfovibrio sp.]|uniref:hypothetical protein n=1 Tax=Halodesulfovibrio sp. TaxID=1912772 RepID=UPI0025F077D0|nr:hypothetical protein [Halodesulfovibrio sp.]MCT4533749.1 hypothetical protein [Halodesulfovibrio sp.]